MDSDYSAASWKELCRRYTTRTKSSVQQLRSRWQAAEAKCSEHLEQQATMENGGPQAEDSESHAKPATPQSTSQAIKRKAEDDLEDSRGEKRLRSDDTGRSPRSTGSQSPVQRPKRKATDGPAVSRPGKRFRSESEHQRSFQKTQQRSSSPPSQVQDVEVEEDPEALVGIFSQAANAMVYVKASQAGGMSQSNLQGAQTTVGDESESGNGDPANTDADGDIEMAEASPTAAGPSQGVQGNAEASTRGETLGNGGSAAVQAPPPPPPPPPSPPPPPPAGKENGKRKRNKRRGANPVTGSSKVLRSGRVVNSRYNLRPRR